MTNEVAKDKNGRVLTISRELWDQMSSIDTEVKYSVLDAEKLTADAKSGTPRKGWIPYCVRPRCSSSGRMNKEPYGFSCSACKNIIGHNLYRLKESPTNYV